MGALSHSHNRDLICYFCVLIIVVLSLGFFTGNTRFGDTLLPAFAYPRQSINGEMHEIPTGTSNTEQKTNETTKGEDKSVDVLAAPDISGVGEDTLLVIVPSHVSELKTRITARSSWANSSQYKTVGGKIALVTIFVIGTQCNSRNCESSSKEIEIAREVQTYSDILLLNMSDSYTNLVEKLRMSMEWVVLHSTARYILKVDCDVMPNTFAWLRVVDTLLAKEASCLIAGFPLVNTPVSRIGKYAITKDEYNLPRYPNYVGGAAYLMSRDAVVTILDMTSQGKYFMMEDVYFTGMAVRNTHVHILGIPNTAYLPLFIIPDDFNSEVINRLGGVLMVHNIPDKHWSTMWRKFQSNNKRTDGKLTFRLIDITENNATLPMQWIFRNNTNNMCTYMDFDLDVIG